MKNTQEKIKREIKFRIKIAKGFGDEGKWEYFTVKDLCDADYAHGSNTFDWMTLGEFTGLKDKNGKEIYNGDFMKFSDFYDSDGYKHDEYIAEVRFPDNIVYFIPEKMGGLAGEIIGNIYENPELLELLQK